MTADTQTMIMPIIIVAFGLFAGGMYAYRKLTAGETFSWQKFLPTMGIGAIASMGLYLASGALPSLDSIFTQIETMAPGGAPSVTVILAALLAIYNQWSKGTTASATVTTPATQAATTEQVKSTLITVTPSAEAWSPGLTVSPTFSRGVSPMPVNITVQVGTENAGGKRCKVQVDWMDGSPLEVYSADELTGIVVIPHTYKYLQGTTKYTGHSFYPEITAMTSDGSTKIESINVDGKSCEIEVQSK